MKHLNNYSKLVAILLVTTLILSISCFYASAAFVEYSYSGSDSNGAWKVSEFEDSSTRNQFMHVYTDCWKKSNGTRYHEHIMMTPGSSPITRLTVTAKPVYYSSGNAIGSERRFDAYNTTVLRVMPQSINSGGSKVTLFATLESQHSTATYTYHNIYGV